MKLPTPAMLASLRAAPTAFLAPLALTASLVGCKGAEEPKPLAKKTEEIATVEKKTVESMTFGIVTDGAKVGFEMQAPIEKQDGSVPPEAVGGSLNVDLADLSKSTGLVNVDISNLEIYQQKAEEGAEGEYGERVKSDLQNEHMKDWLEIGDDAPAAERKKNSVIQFKLDDVVDASATNISELDGATRTVTFTGVGDFRLHQRSAKKEVKLEATFHYADGAPTSVTVKTVEPFAVDLAEHEVRPRTGFGQLAEKTLGSLSPKVASQAQVSIALTAKPN